MCLHVCVFARVGVCISVSVHIRHVPTCLAHCISLERLLFLMRRCPFGNNDGDDDDDGDSVLDDDDDDDISLE